MKFIIEIPTESTIGMILALHSFSTYLFNSSDYRIDEEFKNGPISYTMGDITINLRKAN